MRPYFAIIKDSFHEAIASRVLLVLLIINALMVLVLFPFGYHETLTIEFRRSDMGRPDQQVALAARIFEASKKDTPSPGKHVFSLLDDKFQKSLADQLQQAQKPDDKRPRDPNGGAEMRVFEEFRRKLNELVKKEEFFDAKSWESVDLGAEAKELKARGLGNLSKDERGRFNRLAFESAYRDIVTPSSKSAYTYAYLGFPFPSEPISGSLNTRSELKESVLGYTRFIFSWGVGAAGVLIALLMTASIIPETFDAGSLHLLLSKPITRSMLFLSKFLGACIFIVISISVLLCGCFLILGFRFGVWYLPIFACIPIYVFVFAVYYAASALAGLIWRSSIVSIALAVLFWFICFGLGYGEYFIREQALYQSRIAKISPLGEGYMSVTEDQSVRVWDAEKANWDEVFSSNELKQIRTAMQVMRAVYPVQFPPPLGVIYDEKNQQLVSIDSIAFRPPFGPRFSYAKAPDFKRQDGPPAPLGALVFLKENPGAFLVVAQSGLFRIDGAKLSTEKSSPSLFGISMGGSGFENVGPAESLLIDRPAQAAYDTASGTLGILSRGRVLTLKRGENGKFVLTKETKLPDISDESAKSMGAGVSITANHLLIALQSGRVVILDHATHEVIYDKSPEETQQPRAVASASSANRFWVLFHDGKVCEFEVKNNSAQMTRPALRGQGDITALQATSAGLFVADRTNRITNYSLTDLKIQSEINPPMAPLDIVYRYFVKPLYLIFPKPGEVEKTVRYVLLEKNEVASEFAGTDISVPPEIRSDPWRPLITSGVFLVIMLGLCCFYIERQEY